MGPPWEESYNLSRSALRPKTAQTSCRSRWVRVSPSTVRRLLISEGLKPARRRSGPSWGSVHPPAGRECAGVRLHRRDGHFAPLLRPLLHRGREPPRPHRRLHDDPTGAWVSQQARNLSFSGILARTRFLIHDRDSKFSAALDEVFRSEGIKIIETPIRALRANAYAERFVQTVRVECLDWLLILGRHHLECVLRTYTAHDNAERPHRSLSLSPDGSEECRPAVVDTIERRNLLGGLIHEYRAAA